jgi:hypothetical protein
MCVQKSAHSLARVDDPKHELLKTAAALAVSLLGLLALSRAHWFVPPSLAGGQPREARTVTAEHPEIPRPAWRVGDRWEIETVARQIQDRHETVPASAPIRWRFEVAGMERKLGRNCFRIDVICETKGRTRPRTTLWCDAETLMIREVQTQLASGGRYRTLQESYESGPTSISPILTPLTALPLDLPAFQQSGAQHLAKGVGKFTYTSQPLAAGAKDPAILRFTQEVEQNTGIASAKSLGLLAPGFAKGPDDRPVIEVQLKTRQRSVVQLWQAGQPWPSYTDNIHTQARLVSINRKP